MISYLNLRWRIYSDELQQLLASLQQLMTFLLLMLYLALPILILTPLLCLSIIADINTSLVERVIYQWFYLALLYLLVRIQRKAVIASRYQHYLASVPQSTISSKLASILLTCMAGNLLLLAPLALLAYLPNWQAMLANVHFISFALAAIAIAWLAITKAGFAWFSLVTLPAALLLMMPLDIFSAATMNLTMLAAIFFSDLVPWPSSHGSETPSLTSYWQLRFIALKSKPSSGIFRLVTCVLILVLIVYVQYQVEQTAADFVQVFVCWLVSIILGSQQFDNEKFHHSYHYYLANFSIDRKVRYLFDVLPALFVSIFLALVMIYLLSFSYFVLVLLPLACLLTQFSVHKFMRNFFILPSLVFATLLAFMLSLGS